MLTEGTFELTEEESQEILRIEREARLAQEALELLQVQLIQNGMKMLQEYEEGCRAFFNKIAARLNLDNDVHWILDRSVTPHVVRQETAEEKEEHGCGM